MVVTLTQTDAGSFPGARTSWAEPTQPVSSAATATSSNTMSQRFVVFIALPLAPVAEVRLEEVRPSRPAREVQIAVERRRISERREVDREPLRRRHPGAAVARLDDRALGPLPLDRPHDAAARSLDLAGVRGRGEV